MIYLFPNITKLSVVVRLDTHTPAKKNKSTLLRGKTISFRFVWAYLKVEWTTVIANRVERLASQRASRLISTRKPRSERDIKGTIWHHHYSVFIANKKHPNERGLPRNDSNTTSSLISSLLFSLSRRRRLGLHFAAAVLCEFFIVFPLIFHSRISFSIVYRFHCFRRSKVASFSLNLIMFSFF